MQQLLIICNSRLLKQSDGKLSQTIIMYLNYLIIVMWHFLNRRLYPDKRHHVQNMTLRPRGHNFSFPKCRLQSTRKSFINMVYCLHVYNVKFILIYLFFKVLDLYL